MKNALLVLFSLATATVYGAENTLKVTGVRDAKKVAFSENDAADGVRVVVDLGESCHDESPFQSDEFENAPRGDHVWLEFSRPTAVKIMGEKIEIAELVLRLPTNTGVFWLRSGNKVRRFTKFEPQKVQPFGDWFKEAQPAN
ncbi:hypothetical protein ACYOEI_19535 [Singulisphaera rosea]